MIDIVSITLENEMDLVLAHKKTLNLGEKLQMTLTTQSVFATAVTEISREIIEKTNTGEIILGLCKEQKNYSLQAIIKCGGDDCYSATDDGFVYARKLVPFYNEYSEGNIKIIELKISIPTSNKISPLAIDNLIYYFENVLPFTPYEAIKRKINALNLVAEKKEEQLKESKITDEKKTEFISIASHELKTPVTIIKAYAQLAKLSKEECGPAIKNFIKKIEEQVSRLSVLINQLLDVSKLERDTLDYRFEDVSINHFLEEATSLLQHTVPNHPIDLKLDKDSLVKIDKFRIEQVLSNLISNAAKYSDPESQISINTTLSKSKGVVISIKDEGIGMSRENIENVFQKFYRNEEVIQKYSGLGMGLYISSKIVKEHGGEIWADSEPKKGSVFHFSIPLYRPLKKETL